MNKKGLFLILVILIAGSLAFYGCVKIITSIGDDGDDKNNLVLIQPGNMSVSYCSGGANQQVQFNVTGGTSPYTWELIDQTGDFGTYSIDQSGLFDTGCGATEPDHGIGTSKVKVTDFNGTELTSDSISITI